jgi:adenylate cyclase
VTDPANDPMTDRAKDPVTDPANDPMTDRAKDPVTDPATDAVADPAPRDPGSSPRHAGTPVWAVALALAIPIAGLVLLRVRTPLDIMWQHDPTHFWLVLGAATLSAITAYGTGTAASRRGDARVMFVSLAFLSAAGFLALHALATPHVLLTAPSVGFNLSTPVGLAIGALFAVSSTGNIDGDRALPAMRVALRLRVALVAFIVLWALVSLIRVPPFDRTGGREETTGALLVLGVVATLLYLWSAVTYLRLWRRRGGPLPLSMAAALVLLGEAMVAITVAPNWHLSWWEWHVLMLAAFVLVAWGAQQSWHEERYADIYLDETRSGSREMSILFADLKGFTSFSEHHEPSQVTAMLNAYFDVAIPAVVKRYGGVVDRIIGDALMVTFNRKGDQPDHAVRAARAGLAIQEETARVAAEHEGWPRFRVGINSGVVSMSVLGSVGGRTHTMIGDVVNVASRLEGQAPVGGVAVSADTLARLPGAVTEPLGALDLKGKEEPVEAFVLRSVPD